MSGLRIHMVGNAHLDPAWMWTWDEGMEAFLATVRSALDRIDESPGVVFTCSSAAHYQWIESIAPELFERVHAAVHAGRWSVVGGWWLQADCNIPSGEGFVRQALLGQRYFQSRFGFIARTGYSPDAFGHSAGLPQLLARSGMQNYVFCRPDPGELTLPSPLFEWRSSDGSTVLAYRVPLHYNMYETSVPKKVRELSEAYHAASSLAADRMDLARFGTTWCLFYGIGNHGGGPTREHIRQIQEIDADESQPQLLFSSPDAFFDDVRRDRDARWIPEWRDDLQIDAPGCYSAHSAIKRLNRRAEHSLVAAEAFATMATARCAVEYPIDELRAAWQHVCFNHFHDIVCGVATREALDDAINQYGAALTSATSIARMSLQRIAGAIDTTGDGQTLIVANAHAWRIDENVRFELWHDIDKSLWTKPVDIRVTDDDGVELPSQTGFTSGKIGRDRIAVTFPASIPAFGWRCYRVHYGSKSTIPDAFPGRAEATLLENRHLRLTVDKERGAIRVTALAWHGETRMCDGAAVGLVIDDPTDTWGHGVERFDNVLGTFTDPDVRLVASGPAYATVRMLTRYGSSWLQQDFTLAADADFIDVDVKLMWTEHHRMLKLSFPTSIDAATSQAEAAYAQSVHECDGRERPCGTWFAVASNEIALGIVTDAKHGYSCDRTANGAELRMSVLRSPSYATHDPHPFDPNEDLDFLDQGVQRFRYRIVPMSNGLNVPLLTRSGIALSAPPITHIESEHAGVSERAFEGIAIDPQSVVATVLKRSEDSDAWILRLFESSGMDADVVVDIPLLGAHFTCAIGAHELRTFRIADDGVTEANLVEM